MDLAYSAEQAQFRDSVSRYIRDRCSFEARRDRLASGGFDATLWKEIAELGWFALPFAEADGGLGGSAVDLALVMDGIGRALIVEPVAPSIAAGLVIAAVGDDRQRMAWVEPFLAGRSTLAIAFAEADNPCDLSRTGTSAARDADGWRLEGTKTMVVGGDQADVVVVPAKLPDGGLGIFVVPTDAPGVDRFPYELHDSTAAADIVLDDAAVSHAHLLAGTSDALSTLERVFDFMIAAQAAEATGAMEAAFHLTLDYLKNRHQFARPLSANQALQHRMVDVYAAVEQARSAALSAALAMELATPHSRSRAVSLAKIEINRLSRLVGQEAIQLHGAIGTTDDLPVSHYFRRLTLITRTLGDTDWHIRRIAGFDGVAI